jgi:hypothetical protein
LEGWETLFFPICAKLYSIIFSQVADIKSSTSFKRFSKSPGVGVFRNQELHFATPSFQGTLDIPHP